MKTARFIFPELPHITNVIAWKKSVEKDIFWEFGKLYTEWDTDSANPKLSVVVLVEKEEELFCMLHNLHSAKAV